MRKRGHGFFYDLVIRHAGGIGVQRIAGEKFIFRIAGAAAAHGHKQIALDGVFCQIVYKGQRIDVGGHAQRVVQIGKGFVHDDDDVGLAVKLLGE